MSDAAWIARHLPPGAFLADLTSAWTTIGLWGPRARDVLASVTPDDVSHRGFGFGTCREIEVGVVVVLASRISYVGELGWELHVPIEQGARLWDMLWQAGQPAGPRPGRSGGGRAAVDQAGAGRPARGPRAGRHRRVRHVRTAREGVPRLRRRADPRLHAGRGGHDPAQGEGAAVHRQGGLPAAARRAAVRGDVHADRGLERVRRRHAAVHAGWRADPHAGGRG